MDTGSAVPSMTTNILNQIELIIPTQEVLKCFDEALSKIYNIVYIKTKDTSKLTELQSFLLAKIGQ